MALILALKRHIHTGRDNQSATVWRGLISEIGAREDELGDKTLLIVGRVRIGTRLARLTKAFDMKVVATRRNPDCGADGADAVFGHDRLREVLAEADIVALTCPLTRETENLIDAKALALMKPTAHLVHVAEGVIDGAALLSALQERPIAAGLDVTRLEPLAGGSVLWTMRNVVITPRAAGETQPMKMAPSICCRRTSSASGGARPSRQSGGLTPRPFICPSSPRISPADSCSRPSTCRRALQSSTRRRALPLRSATPPCLSGSVRQTRAATNR